MPPSRTDHTKAQTLATLRTQIRKLEGFKSEAGQTLPLGVAEIDAALPGGGLALGRAHELDIPDPETAAAAAGFLAVILARLAEERGAIVWIAKGRTLYAPGLLPYGLQPENIIFAQARNDGDALWAMEESLRCKALAAVVGEAGDAGLIATRRLQLAAESSLVTAFLLRHTPKQRPSACDTSWQINPAPGGSWQVKLVRARGGRPGQWRVVWNGRSFSSSDRSAEAYPL